MTREEAIKEIKSWDFLEGKEIEAIQTLVPELRESEDERIRKALIDCLNQHKTLLVDKNISSEQAISYLEKQKDAFENGRQFGIMQEQARQELEWTDKKQKEESLRDYIDNFPYSDQKEQKSRDYCSVRDEFDLDGNLKQNPIMIQWTGKNLKEVIDFTGKSNKFDEWFKSWEDFENYVHSHSDILKLFYEDGSHYEIPVGAWIVKTPDGYNIPSRFRFIQKPIEWSEKDKEMLIKVEQIVLKHWNGLSDAFHYKYDDENQDAESCYNWLKSLPERFNPQPKQEWSEEDDWKRKELIQYLEEKGDYRTVWMTWLKSLRPQPHKEIYQAAKRDLTIKFMNYLDENRPEGKMSLSNGECEDIDKAFKEGDWAKIIRYIKKYQPHWKPSDEQLRPLEYAIDYFKKKRNDTTYLESLYNDLKKLM